MYLFGVYLVVSDTAELRSCPWFGGSRSADWWCSRAPPSASGACGSGCPPAAALSESTSPCRLGYETKRENVCSRYQLWHQLVNADL